MHSTRDDVLNTLKENPCDLLYIDSQHGAHTEWDIVRICATAEEVNVPVQLRIKHTRQTYLIGNYLDLGPLAIKVPEVETATTVNEAINAFYYPPIGKRSWGGPVGYGIKKRPDRREYAQWWNQNGILCIKVESIKAVINVRELVKPGIDYLDFGTQDLLFDLEHSNHPTLITIQDCIEHVRNELKNSQFRIMTS